MDIAAYFGLKAGMVVDNENDAPNFEVIKETLIISNTKLVPSVIPGIEISHFAVNDNYRRKISRSNNPVSSNIAHKAICASSRMFIVRPKCDKRTVTPEPSPGAVRANPGSCVW